MDWATRVSRLARLRSVEAPKAGLSEVRAVYIDGALATTAKAREAYGEAGSRYEVGKWNEAYAEPLLRAAETLRSKANEAEAVGEMLSEALRARGATHIPSRMGDRLILLLSMAELVVTGAVRDAGGSVSQARVTERWRVAVHDLEMIETVKRALGAVEEMEVGGGG